MEQRLTTFLQQKWLSKMLGYDYEITYKKGTENVVTMLYLDKVVKSLKVRLWQLLKFFLPGMARTITVPFGTCRANLPTGDMAGTG